MHQNNLNAIDLNLLKVLSEIERQGSVTGAAEVLGLGQPAVSQALSRLRETLKDDLFVRGPGGMTPTPHMRDLTGPLRAALGQIEETIFGSQAFDPAQSDTRYRMGASDYAAALLVPEIMTAMAKRMPQARLAVLRADRLNAEQMLSDGEIDLAIGLFPRPGKWVRRRKLYSESHVCVFNPALIQTGTRLSLEDFVRHPHMLVSLDGTDQGFVDKILADLGTERRVAITTPFFLQSAYLLEHQPLIATLPERFVRACSRLSRMAIHPLPFESPGFNVAAIWRTADERNPRFQALQETILGIS